jgi:hypothetical protein
MGKRQTKNLDEFLVRLYAVLQRVIDDNPDTDWSVIKDQLWHTVVANHPDVLRAILEELVAGWHKEFEAERADKPARGFDLDYASRADSKPKRYGRPKPN